MRLPDPEYVDHRKAMIDRVMGDDVEYAVGLTESQRQMVLLAMHKLRLERPGWDHAIGEVEDQLAGQIDWPNYDPPFTVAGQKVGLDG